MRSNGLSAALGRPGTLLCLVACVCIAAFFVFVDEALAHEGDEGGLVVHVTEEGFEPQSVEIGPGETVVFENEDDEGHWPASDSHPTHEEYSAFDPKRPIQPNTQWSFTFEEPGEWEYHDHMNPYLMGKILVEDDGEWGGGFESACAYGVGMQTMNENLNDPDFVESECTSGEPEQRGPCVAGMAALYVSHHGSLGPARVLCTQREPSNRRACYDSVRAYPGLFADRSS
ncbi:MAG: cupredoxin domain-containing protein [Pyrinomonadaceae bacterium]|nr:cupredoxin domain-containing protein [Pyrinomonadaceae bacterium]